jgi:hypothetical protein
MQTIKDKKNRNALLQWSPRKILSDLANMPSPRHATAAVEAEAFIDRYGPLNRTNPPDIQPLEAMRLAPMFRLAWDAHTERDKEYINAFLDGVFSAAWTFDRGEHPAIKANFDTGRWEPQPRTLLDVLAVTLMRSRKMLHRCERPECARYFVKEFSRDRYCKTFCSDIMRERGQTKWAVDHRDQVNAKRRKPGKKPR